ncbi:60S ribosomal protein L23a-like [Pteronotus mesoamericanus]|uniref:60S ribosomal protein L23a-like n=1 Tax=Pteronotus mesoamericanus TaxID=1884717 RepID=UPI0023EBB7C7|nr:60S ribosomal protein L23a-like [Pteronotus parnellii mesoamericanus]
MAPKVKMEAPSPPRAEAEAKALKAKKVALKGAPGHKRKEMRTLRTSGGLRRCGAGAADMSLEERPLGDEPDHSAIIRFPRPRVSRGGDRRQQHAVFIGEAEAKEQQTRGAGGSSETCRGHARSPMGPKGGEKACAGRAPDEDASDAASRLGIVHTESSG